MADDVGSGVEVKEVSPVVGEVEVEPIVVPVIGLCPSCGAHYEITLDLAQPIDGIANFQVKCCGQCKTHPVLELVSPFRVRAMKYLGKVVKPSPKVKVVAGA